MDINLFKMVKTAKPVYWPLKQHLYRRQLGTTCVFVSSKNFPRNL